jgi:hypothetical protein
MNDTMSKLSKKVNSLELYVKTKDCSLTDAHNKISFMSRLLSFSEDIFDYPKEIKKKNLKR